MPDISAMLRGQAVGSRIHVGDATPQHDDVLAWDDAAGIGSARELRFLRPDASGIGIPAAREEQD
jgi:hypothetical protein